MIRSVNGLAFPNSDNILESPFSIKRYMFKCHSIDGKGCFAITYQAGLLKDGGEYIP
jgi:hypothetical protein